MHKNKKQYTRAQKHKINTHVRIFLFCQAATGSSQLPPLLLPLLLLLLLLLLHHQLAVGEVQLLVLLPLLVLVLVLVVLLLLPTLVLLQSRVHH